MSGLKGLKPVTNTPSNGPVNHRDFSRLVLRHRSARIQTIEDLEFEISKGIKSFLCHTLPTQQIKSFYNEN